VACWFLFCFVFFSFDVCNLRVDFFGNSLCKWLKEPGALCRRARTEAEILRSSNEWIKTVCDRSVLNVTYIQDYYKRNRHFQRYVVSPDNSLRFLLMGVYQRQSFRSSTSGKFKRTETAHHNSCCKWWRGYAQVCLDRIRPSYWYLSCDKRLTHRTFVT